MGDAVVGVVANPLSGRDIRRLVTQASVFPTAEKANMIQRNGPRRCRPRSRTPSPGPDKQARGLRNTFNGGRGIAGWMVTGEPSRYISETSRHPAE